jgi:hypothetical protein
MRLAVPRSLWPSVPLSLLLFSCSDHTDLSGPTGPAVIQASRALLPPAALASIPVANGTAEIWAYLTDDLATEQDPVNLVFTGRADPREIRNLLLGLTGDRASVFPTVFPFTCTWSDAIGGLLAGFGAEAGWGGTAVQLQCGEYGPIRFHLRLVKLGAFTIGNVHFEVVIPGTTDHQVLSWELAEQLVTFDLARSGLLGAAPADAGAINAAPSHRSIPALIYNGLPVELRAVIGGPLGNVTSPVGIPTNGHPTAFLLAGAAPPAAASAVQHFTIDFNQVIPKPFCAAGPGDFLFVQGPVVLEQEVTTRPGEELRKVFRASGELTATPIDIATGFPTGASFAARVSEQQESQSGPAGGDVKGLQHQQLIGVVPGSGQLLIRLDVSPGKTPRFDRKVTCQ